MEVEEWLVGDGECVFRNDDGLPARLKSTLLLGNTAHFEPRLALALPGAQASHFATFHQ
jgi:hypothetical protein